MNTESCSALRSARGRAAGALAALLVLSACAAGDGTAWGVWSPELRVQHDATDRVTSSGALVTVERLEVQVDALSIELGALALTTGGGGASAFDPASPPEGYGLCHAGHCHADDGSLVPYETIAAELGEGTPSAPAAVAPVALTVPLDAALAPVPIGGCADGCALERGTLNALTLEVDALSFEVRIRDPELGRFDGERRLTATIPLDAQLASTVALSVGPNAAPNLTTRAVAVLDARWVDAFSANVIGALAVDAPLPNDLDAALTEAIAASLSLRVTSTRKSFASPPGVTP